MISVVIAHKNDIEMLTNAIGVLNKNAFMGDYEIIVADDNSFPDVFAKVNEIPNIRVVQTGRYNGVGAAFDRGVSMAVGDDILLIGADVELPSMWDEKVVLLSETYPGYIICGKCVKASSNKTVGHGATISWKTGVPNTLAGSNIIEAKWIRYPGKGVFDVPCVLGAAYVVKKEFYEYIHGWTGHRFWGGLEPFISIKAWLAGNGCKCDPAFVVKHHFKRYKNNSEIVHSRSIRPDWMYYNKMFIAETMLTAAHKADVLSHLSVQRAVGQGRKHINENKSILLAEKAHNEKIFCRTSEFLIDKFV